MINPSKLIGLLVTDLRSCPTIVRHLNNDPARILEYTDVAPKNSSLTRAIYEMKAPGALIAYMGTTPTDESDRLSHSISIYLRARDSADTTISTYAALITDLYNAKPLRLEGQKLLNSEFAPGVRQVGIPAAQRIHDEQGTIDIFEIVTRFEEDFDNDGTTDEF